MTKLSYRYCALKYITFLFFILFFIVATKPANATHPFVCTPVHPPNNCVPLSNVTCLLIDGNVLDCPNPVGGSFYNVASCDEFDHTEGLNHYFKRHYYRIKKDGTGLCGSRGWAYSHTWFQTGSANTNIGPSNCSNFASSGAPPGCNQGTQPGNLPPGESTPTPGGGGSCPPQYQPPVSCNVIPCAYKTACNCLCENPPCAPNECSGGPPPPPTATPTPTPFCTLSCPGQGGGPVGGGAGSLGTGYGAPTPTGFQPPETIGNIAYAGFNGFICGLFKNALGYDGACPNTGLDNTFSEPVRYHMLCGGNPYTYKAQVDSSAGGDAGGPQPTPTQGPTPTIGLYPPNCSINPTIPPSPTPIAGDPGGGAGNANFCSCSVTLGCQTALQPVSSTNCSSSCDAIFIPDNPVYNEEMGIAITGTPSSFNFDDGTTPIPNPAPSLAHTFANAGVYRTALDCGGGNICQKTLNVYCSYIPKLWYKVSGASFHKLGGLQNSIPDPIIAYDNDDTTERLFDIKQAGVVTSTGTINVGTGTVSSRQWKRENYVATSHWTPALYLEYIKSRKTYVSVIDGNSDGTISSSELTKDAINIAPVGNFIISSSSIQSKTPFVLIIQGDATISGNINPPEKSLAIIVTGKLNITSAVRTASGIFIAQSMDLASDISAGQTTPNTLKVNGNLISITAADLSKRKSDVINKPSLFVVAKPEMYIDLLSYLNTRNYNYQELAP